MCARVCVRVWVQVSVCASVGVGASVWVWLIRGAMLFSNRFLIKSCTFKNERGLWPVYTLANKLWCLGLG
jgi:hypothetical protein